MNRCLLLAGLYLMSMTVCAQNKKNREYGGYVKFESATTPGTLTLISTGFAKKILESSKDAGMEAFFSLLFRGIPGSQYELPMIPDENEKRNHPTVKSLLDGGYTAFVIEDVLLGQEDKVKKEDGMKGKMTIHKITIDCNALRRYLEQNSVIRKFGY